MIEVNDLRYMLGEILIEYEHEIQAREEVIDELRAERDKLDKRIADLQSEAQALAEDRKAMSGDLEHRVRAAKPKKTEEKQKPKKRVNDFSSED